MTNYEKIKNMNIDEMAKFISDSGGDCFFCPALDSCGGNCPDCEETIKTYLESEAE